jgi:hypothetical protein
MLRTKKDPPVEATLNPFDPVRATERQIAYWRNELAIANESEDMVRVAQCQEFVIECELVIAALRI